MIRKFIFCAVIIAVLFSLVGCLSEDKKILKEFDMSDPKELWNGSIEDDFADDTVGIVFRRTLTFPELELRYFKLNNAESVEYIALRPPENYEAQGGKISEYHQIATIHLKDHGKEKVIEAVRHLEKLDFLKGAYPNVFDRLDA